MSESAESVLEFWFADAVRSPERAAGRIPTWFEANAAFDEALRTRFGAAVARAARGELASWELEARGALALVLLLDQLPRNIFRGSADAFASDPLALAITRRALERGLARALAPIEHVFLLLPLEHAESLDAQRECVARARALAESSPPEWSPVVRSFVPFAEQHLAIIERFGRFPHRNRLLGRASTREEAAYLTGGGATFGQSA